MGNRQQALEFSNQAKLAAQDKDNPRHLEHALHLFASACMADPTWGQSFYDSGNNFSELNAPAAAIASWRRALQCEMSDNDRAKCLANLGWRLHTLGRTQEALEATKLAIQLDPNAHLALINLSCIYQVLNERRLMVDAAERAYDILPGDPNCQISLSFAYLFDRQLKKGFEHFECRFKYKLKNYLQFPYPKWEGEPDKTIFLDSDQGLGDTLSFARFVPLVAKKARFIHLAVQPELQHLFMHAFVQYPNINIMVKPAAFPEADCWSTFVSLPWALGLSDDEITGQPHISCPARPLPNASFWKVPDRKLHVGIAWAGSPLNDINPHRSIPVTQFFELYRVPGVQLYALQVGAQAQELYDNHGTSLVKDLNPMVRDVVDTVNILKQLDLVICCESALGHIAALADKECWLPYSWQGRDWRLGLDGKDSFWTPKHRTFNQGPNRQWGPVFDEIVEALREKIDGLDRKIDKGTAEVRPAHQRQR